MDRSEYPILLVVAIAVIGIGVGATSKPLAQFFVDGTREFVTTTVAMAWITWWALVVHFLFAGLGLVPPRSGATVAEVSIETDYKLVLNVLAAGLFAVLYWLHRSSPSEGDGGQPTHAQAAE